MLPLFIDKYKDKLPNNPKLNDLIEGWDNVGLLKETLDLYIAGQIPFE